MSRRIAELGQSEIEHLGTRTHDLTEKYSLSETVMCTFLFIGDLKHVMVLLNTQVFNHIQEFS